MLQTKVPKSLPWNKSGLALWAIGYNFETLLIANRTCFIHMMDPVRARQLGEAIALIHTYVLLDVC